MDTPLMGLGRENRKKNYVKITNDNYLFHSSNKKVIGSGPGENIYCRKQESYSRTATK